MTRLSRTTTACLEFDGHPVATSENSVDLSHLAEVHHYTDVVMVHPFSADATAGLGVVRDDASRRHPW